MDRKGRRLAHRTRLIPAPPSALGPSNPVSLLPAVTPYCLLDLGGGSVNELSYQQARNNRAAVGQVYVAESGGQECLGF